MALIIAHHYVVNSGVTGLYSISAHPARTLFLQSWGMFGKAGINAFVLLSGYFMCQSRLTPIRFLKVILPIVLYRALTYAVGIALGLAKFSLAGVAAILLDLLSGAGSNGFFGASFPVFYLLIPVLIVIVRRLTGNELGLLVLFSLLLYTGLGTFFKNPHLFNEVLWFCVLFLIAAWIRLYANRWSSDFWGCFFALLICVSGCLLFIAWRDFFFGTKGAYYLVDDPSRIGSLGIGLFIFLVFRNLQIRQCSAVNWLASHTFGVLLFHANWVGRKLLWQAGGLFDVSAAFSLPLPELILHAAVAVLAVFAAGTLFDSLIASPAENLLYRFYEKSEPWMAAHSKPFRDKVRKSLRALSIQE